MALVLAIYIQEAAVMRLENFTPATLSNSAKLIVETKWHPKTLEVFFREAFNNQLTQASLSRHLGAGVPVVAGLLRPARQQVGPENVLT